MSTATDLDRGQAALRAEAERLGAATGSVTYRMALERIDGGPAAVLRLELTIGHCDDESREWDYGGVVFASGWLAAEAAASWLRDKAGEVSVGRNPMAFAFRELSDSGDWERLPSQSGRDEPPLIWPYRRVAFRSAHALGPSSRPRFLVGPGAPSFPSFEHAAHEFFHGCPLVGARAQAADVVVVREQDDDVRIDKVRFSASSVEVALSSPARSRTGDRRAVRVEFAPGVGERPRFISFDHRHQEAVESFPLPDGVPDQWWAVVSEDHRWVDYRHYSRYGPWPSDAELLRGALDPTDEVRMLALGGEGQAMEFKRQLPSDRDSARRLARTVAAFANGRGGTILFGVEDDATIVGIRESFRAASDQLTCIVSDNLTTRPVVRLEEFDTDDGTVVELGAQPPYGIDPNNPRYYVRFGATTRPARPEEVRSLVQVGPRSGPGYGSGLIRGGL